MFVSYEKTFYFVSVWFWAFEAKIKSQISASLSTNTHPHETRHTFTHTLSFGLWILDTDDCAICYPPLTFLSLHLASLGIHSTPLDSTRSLSSFCLLTSVTILTKCYLLPSSQAGETRKESILPVLYLSRPVWQLCIISPFHSIPGSTTPLNRKPTPTLYLRSSLSFPLFLCISLCMFLFLPLLLLILYNPSQRIPLWNQSLCLCSYKL